MIDRININTEGGDYEEVNNHGQYAKGDIHNNYQQTPAKLRDSSEAKLLAAVKNEVAGRLAQSLHNRVYIELHKEEDPSQVIQPWAVDVKLGNQPSQRCPEGTNIVDIFDKPEIGGKLLILGAPGSGKTMMLLQLAEELVQRAGANAAYPVPVLLNLSAWKPEFKDIPSWMVADLKLKYGVRQDIAKKWIEEGRILPLLDGLDELMSERQETCVRALNEFLPAWSGVPLVVCSRREEYQNYEANLGLNGAVILQPLTDGQIEKFLRGAGCEWLWEVVRQDSDVMGQEGLARSPLLLTILVLASDGLPGELWQKEESAEERRRVLFEAYIAERLKRRYVGGKNLPATKHGQKPYKDDEKTKAWLGWLALWSIKENQTEFFIEKLQPKFLTTRRQKIVYKLIYVLSVGLVGSLVLGFSFRLFYERGGLLGGLIGGLVVVLVYGLTGGTKQPKTITTAIFSWRKTPKKFFYKNLLYGLLGWLIVGLVIGLFYGLVIGLVVGLFHGLGVGLFYGLLYGLPNSLVFGLFIGLFISLINIEEVAIETQKDNQVIHTIIFNSIAFSLMSIFCIILNSVTSHYYYFNKPLDSNQILYDILFSSFLLGVSGGGLISGIDHYALRLTLCLFNYSPLNYSKFLRYCTDRGFLQRVGGGYRFVHALLRDHFATQYIPR